FAFYFGIKNLKTYSGGTEATSFHPHAVNALKAAGFGINSTGAKANPLYKIKYAEATEPVLCSSKLFGHSSNEVPFAAIMTCSEAEANCPIISEAEARYSLPYDDPRIADGTAFQAQAY